MAPGGSFCPVLHPFVVKTFEHYFLAASSRCSHACIARMWGGHVFLRFRCNWCIIIHNVFMQMVIVSGNTAGCRTVAAADAASACFPTASPRPPTSQAHTLHCQLLFIFAICLFVLLLRIFLFKIIISVLISLPLQSSSNQSHRFLLQLMMMLLLLLLVMMMLLLLLLL